MLSRSPGFIPSPLQGGSFIALLGPMPSWFHLIPRREGGTPRRSALSFSAITSYHGTSPCIDPLWSPRGGEALQSGRQRVRMDPLSVSSDCLIFSVHLTKSNELRLKSILSEELFCLWQQVSFFFSFSGAMILKQGPQMASGNDPP